MKRFFIITILIISLLKIYPQQLVIKTVDGEFNTIELTSKPKITIKNGFLYVNSLESEISLQLENIDKYYFTNTDLSITVPKIETETPFELNGNQIIFPICDDSRKVSFYSFSGVMLKSFTIEAGRGGYLDISSLVPGIYLVSVNDVTAKIVKK